MSHTDTLNQRSARDAAEAIKAGKITSASLVNACLERISERDADVSAWAHIDPDYARQQAARADEAVAKGEDLGPLHGVPVGVKDIIDTSDFPTENGTPVFAGRRPGEDADVVNALRAAGAVIMGKTVTTELAFFGPGKTKNPHDPERTPGGSSSGSAAAVADFQIPLALGTQTAGSILRPAAYCGCIGFKPTFGLVSRDGVLGQSAPLDTIGGYARTIADIACLTDIIAQKPSMPLTRALLGASNHTPLRLGFVRTASWPQGDPAMQSALERYAREAGATEIRLPESFEKGIKAQQTVQFRDIAMNYGPIVDENPDVMSAKLKEIIAQGKTVDARQYEDALQFREPLYEELAVLAGSFDAILTPAAAGIAPVGLGATGSPAFNGLWTYLGVPAISLPLLTLDGLPLGVQAVALRDQDGPLLRATQALLEKASPSL